MRIDDASDEAAARRRTGENPFPRRLLPKVVLVVLGLASVVTLIFWAIGIVEASALVDLGIAIALGVAASAVWEIVERRVHRLEAPPDRSIEIEPRRETARPGLLAWIAFPLALLLFFAQVPFLALAVHPPIREFLTRGGRVEAYYVNRAERRLEIWFPRPMQRQGTNLRLDETFVPSGLLAPDRGLAEWRDGHTLSLSIDEVRADLGLGEIGAVSINADFDRLDAGSRPFADETGEWLPHQRIDLSSP